MRYLILLLFVILTPLNATANMVVRTLDGDTPPPTCDLVLQDLLTYDLLNNYSSITNLTSGGFDYSSDGNSKPAYLRKNFTNEEFSGDITVEWEWTRGVTPQQDFAIAEVMVLAKNTDDIFETQSTGDLVRVDTRTVEPDNQLKLILNENGVANVAIWPDAVNGTTYHMKFTRDADGGDNGTGLYSLVIRLGDENGAVQSTLSLSAGAGEIDNDWLWLYTFDSFNNGNALISSGTVDNYMVGSCIE